MFKPDHAQVYRAKKISESDLPYPCGYRIAILPLPVDKQMDTELAALAPTLAAAGAVVKSEHQAEREERGQHFGILCGRASSAFTGNYAISEEHAPKVGDVIVFNKYAGLRQEFPPNSGTIYHYCNDEDVLARFEGNVLEDKP